MIVQVCWIPQQLGAQTHQSEMACLKMASKTKVNKENWQFKEE